jgi:hypothetical protein
MDFVEVDAGVIYYYRAVVQKSTSGAVPAGTWTFAYSQGPNQEYTQVTDPCGRTIKYGYYGYGSLLQPDSLWMLGLPKSKEVVGEETSISSWTKSQVLSWDTYQIPIIGPVTGIYVPLLTQKSITRDGKPTRQLQ